MTTTTTTTIQTIVSYSRDTVSFNFVEILKQLFVYLITAIDVLIGGVNIIIQIFPYILQGLLFIALNLPLILILAEIFIIGRALDNPSFFGCLHQIINDNVHLFKTLHDIFMHTIELIVRLFGVAGDLIHALISGVNATTQVISLGINTLQSILAIAGGALLAKGVLAGGGGTLSSMLGGLIAGINLPITIVIGGGAIIIGLLDWTNIINLGIL